MGKKFFSFKPSFKKKKLKKSDYVNFPSYKEERTYANQIFKDLCKKYNYKTTFKKEEIKEAEAIVNQEVSQEVFPERVNHIHREVITIDGVTAKDLDDAIFLKKTDSHYILSVYIADVAHYIKEKSLLNEEALRRGNSVYIGNHVIPMLPELISNGICSLNPYTKRLVLGIDIYIDFEGEVSHCDIYESLIESKYKLDYDSVDLFLRKKNLNILKNVSQSVLDMLLEMEKLSSVLHKKRKQRGSLILNIKHLEFVYDQNYCPIDVYQKDYLTSQRIIEEFMLIANESIGSFLSQTGSSMIYRVHEEPFKENLDFLNNSLKHLPGSFLKGKKLSLDRKSLQNFLDQTKETDYEYLASLLFLRSMKQAYYSSEKKGHFALASKSYVHFTSPIRRYGDLFLHRIVKKFISGDAFKKGSRTHFKKKAEKVAKHISLTERSSVRAERDLIKRHSIWFFKSHIGKPYQAFISSFHKEGIYIYILPYGLDGFVSINFIKKRYDYIPNKNILKKKGKKNSIYRLGDKVNVFLYNLDVEKNKAYFDLLD